MVLSKWIGFREVAATLIPEDRLNLLLESDAIGSQHRGTGWLIPRSYWSPAGPPPPKPDAHGWIPGGVSLRWPLNLDEVELLREDVEKYADLPKSSSNIKKTGRHPGPQKGQVRRYDAEREKLIPAFETILRDDKCTEPEAARRLEQRDHKRLPGAEISTLDSRVKGFLRFYRNRDRDRAGN